MFELQIDPARYYTPAEVAEMLPTRPNTETIRRWIHLGTRGRKLEAVTLGGRILISGRALQDYLVPAPRPARNKIASPSALSASAEKAAQRLAEAGWTAK